MVKNSGRGFLSTNSGLNGSAEMEKFWEVWIEMWKDGGIFFDFEIRVNTLI